MSDTLHGWDCFKSLQDVYVAGVPFDLAIRADIRSPLPSLSIDIHLQRHPALWTMFTDMLNSDGLVYMCECVSIQAYTHLYIQCEHIKLGVFFFIHFMHYLNNAIAVADQLHLRLQLNEKGRFEKHILRPTRGAVVE